MALTVIGGSNFVGRYLIKSLAGYYKEVRLGDMYPFRQSVYRLQEQIGDKLTKHSLLFSNNIKLAMEGTEELVIVTHDYFKLALSKNYYLEKSVFFAREYGVKKVTWVAPFELDQLNTLDGNPENLISQAEAKAKEIFPEIRIIKTNLLFGPNCTSLVIQKTLEDLSKGKSITTNNNGNTYFEPVHEEEFLDTFRNLKPGESVSLSGPEKLQWREIVDILARHCGVDIPSHSSSFNSFIATIATNNTIGDAFYPSHIQQLYRLLNKTREFNSTKQGSKKLRDFYGPKSFHEVPELNWHRIILD